MKIVSWDYHLNDLLIRLVTNDKEIEVARGFRLPMIWINSTKLYRSHWKLKKSGVKGKVSCWAFVCYKVYQKISFDIE